jgi:hypothetical protein
MISHRLDCGRKNVHVHDAAVDSAVKRMASAKAAARTRRPRQAGLLSGKAVPHEQAPISAAGLANRARARLESAVLNPCLTRPAALPPGREHRIGHPPATLSSDLHRLRHRPPSRHCRG